MKQEINLEELLNEISNINLDEDGNRIYYLWEVKKFAKVLCGKLLDLAAENAEIESRIYTTHTIQRENYGQEISIEGVSNGYWCVDANSILQIKDWIK